MQNYKILWADDEIDLLRPHILFLEKKGYEVTAVNSGYDALDKCQSEYFDVVFLDENMPGMSGLEALAKIKARLPNIPVVMITKNEAENIMEESSSGPLDDIEREHIEEVLRITGGNEAKASRMMGISKQTLYSRMKELNIPSAESL